MSTQTKVFMGAATMIFIIIVVALLLKHTATPSAAATNNVQSSLPKQQQAATGVIPVATSLPVAPSNSTGLSSANLAAIASGVGGLANALSNIDFSGDSDSISNASDQILAGGGSDGISTITDNISSDLPDYTGYGDYMSGTGDAIDSFA